jgi:hypothetical protein
MQNNKGEFFVARRNGDGSKVADAVPRCFSTNLDAGKGKNGEWLVNNTKPLKRRGLRLPASGLRKAKEPAAAGLAWQPTPFATCHERRINREFSLP